MIFENGASRIQSKVAEYLTKFRLDTLVYGWKAFILYLHIDCYVVPCLPFRKACRIRESLF